MTIGEDLQGVSLEIFQAEKLARMLWDNSRYTVSVTLIRTRIHEFYTFFFTTDYVLSCPVLCFADLYRSTLSQPAFSHATLYLVTAYCRSEMQSLVRGIGGEFVLPAPGGDVVRDGAGVLPTGRNIHALDPYRIPSAAAMVRGRTAATLILEAHRKKGRSHLCYALFIISSLHILFQTLFLSCSCQARSHVTCTFHQSHSSRHSLLPIQISELIFIAIFIILFIYIFLTISIVTIIFICYCVLQVLYSTHVQQWCRQILCSTHRGVREHPVLSLSSSLPLSCHVMIIIIIFFCFHLYEWAQFPYLSTDLIMLNLIYQKMHHYHTIKSGGNPSATSSHASSDPRVLGPYPGTVAVTLWGLDTIKTKGESVAILLALVGAEPLREVRLIVLIVLYSVLPCSALQHLGLCLKELECLFLPCPIAPCLTLLCLPYHIMSCIAWSYLDLYWTPLLTWCKSIEVLTRPSSCPPTLTLPPITFSLLKPLYLLLFTSLSHHLLNSSLLDLITSWLPYHTLTYTLPLFSFLSLCFYSYSQSTGRIVGFDLIPLSELGRPRIDVLASMSGIFRWAVLSSPLLSSCVQY